MEKNIRIGVAVCKLRFDKGLTVSELAKASGVSPQAILNLENGRFDEGDFLRICETLGTTEESLLRLSIEILPMDPVEARKRLDSLFASS